MLVRFFRKFRIFLKKEDKKVFPVAIILFRIIASLFIILLLPVIFFIIFIMKEPREFVSINNYIKNKSAEIGVKHIDFNSAKLGLNKHFEVVYIVKDLEVSIKDVSVKFPTINFKIKLTDLIKHKIVFEEIELDKFVGHFGYENDERRNNKSSLSYSDVEKIVHNTLDYFVNKRVMFKNFTIKNSEFYFFNRDIKDIDKINIHSSEIEIKKHKSNILTVLMNINITNENKNIKSLNYCNISPTKHVDCKVQFNNLFISDVIKIFTKNTPAQEYTDNINGIFNLEFYISFIDYTKIQNSTFQITSNSGNFLLKEFFPDRIYYTNLFVEGTSKNVNHLSLNKVKAKVGTNKNLNKNTTDFKMSMDVKDKEFMKLNFDIDNAKVGDLNSFWPLFLDDNGIREWVVEHFKTGKINKSFAYMDFEYINNKFVLKDIKSQVNFNNTLLDYDDDFPLINNISATAIFTTEDMNINIKSGNLANTKILNGKVYTNFINKPSINITANTVGNPYEMFYFIENKNRKEVENSVLPYINGIANSTVNIDIPLYKDIDLNSVLVDIEGHVKNNNTFLLKNNSGFDFSVKKDYNSNNFKTKINLQDSYIDFDVIDFVKKKKVNLLLNLDIIIKNNNIVLLNNIYSIGENLKVNGNGKILNGNLTELNINNIKYNNNNFNINYLLLQNNIKTLSVKGDNLHINIANLQNSQKQEINSNFGDLNIHCLFNNIILNNKYNINNVEGNINFVKSSLDNLSIFTTKNDEKILSFNIDKNTTDEDKKYNINGKIKNIGTFLSDLDVTDSVIYGDLYTNGYIDKENKIKVSVRVKNKFGFITKDMKNIKFFNLILNNDLISQKTKDKLTKENSLMFESMRADLYYYKENNDNLLKIKNFILKSDSMFGVGISGKGKFFVDSGKIDFGGVVIPADKLNTLFGINKIPVLNTVLFGSKNGGLFTTGYSFERVDYNSNYQFKLVPISGSSVNSVKNAFLLLLLL